MDCNLPFKSDWFQWINNQIGCWLNYIPLHLSMLARIVAVFTVCSIAIQSDNLFPGFSVNDWTRWGCRWDDELIWFITNKINRRCDALIWKRNTTNTNACYTIKLNSGTRLLVENLNTLRALPLIAGYVLINGALMVGFHTLQVPSAEQDSK